MAPARAPRAAQAPAGPDRAGAADRESASRRSVELAGVDRLEQQRGALQIEDGVRLRRSRRAGRRAPAWSRARRRVWRRRPRSDRARDWRRRDRAGVELCAHREPAEERRRDVVRVALERGRGRRAARRVVGRRRSPRRCAAQRRSRRRCCRGRPARGMSIATRRRASDGSDETLTLRPMADRELDGVGARGRAAGEVEVESPAVVAIHARDRDLAGRSAARDRARRSPARDSTSSRAPRSAGPRATPRRVAGSASVDDGKDDRAFDVEVERRDLVDGAIHGLARRRLEGDDEGQRVLGPAGLLQHRVDVDDRASTGPCASAAMMPGWSRTTKRR